MAKTYINGELVSSSTNYAAAIEYTDKNGNKTTVQDGIDNIVENMGGLRFGIDSNGNYGYIKDGADTVIPFNIRDNVLLSFDFSKINYKDNSPLGQDPVSAFNHTDGYATYNNASYATVIFPPYRTYEMICEVPATKTSKGCLFSFGGSNTSGGALYLTHAEFIMYANGYITQINPGLSTNTKYHIAIVMNQENTKLYVNKQLVGTYGVATYTMRTSTSFLIGYNQSSNSENWADGKMYKLCITQKELTPDQFKLSL